MVIRFIPVTKVMRQRKYHSQLLLVINPYSSIIPQIKAVTITCPFPILLDQNYSTNHNQNKHTNPSYILNQEKPKNSNKDIKKENHPFW